MAISSSKFSLLVTALVVLIAFYVGHIYQQHNKKTKAIMTQHCNNINSDFSRPAERECIYPLDLDDKKFSFINSGGKIEHYEIISTKANRRDLNDNTFYYNFISFGEE